MAESKSGSTIGTENVAHLKTYLEAVEREGRGLPMRGGEVNRSAVALACGFDRQVLYKNPAAKELLDVAVKKLGLAEPGDEDEPVVRTDRRDERIRTLEQQNASLRAEMTGLREKLRRLEHVEDIMITSGRRVSSC
jgi:hypothetical protein